MLAADSTTRRLYFSAGKAKVEPCPHAASRSTGHMNSLLLMTAIAIAVRSFSAARLDRWNLGAPVVMVVAGVVIGLVNDQSIDDGGTGHHRGVVDDLRSFVDGRPHAALASRSSRTGRRSWGETTSNTCAKRSSACFDSAPRADAQPRPHGTGRSTFTGTERRGRRQGYARLWLPPLRPGRARTRSCRRALASAGPE